MCGICGFAYSDSSRQAGVARLVAMRDTIAHRGPDGAGQHVAGPVALGHRRLSIIDVDGGMQPLSNEDGSVWITFNGEIYNYRELTNRLIGLGHRFRTRSDTEAIVHAYEEFGLDFPKYLNGMFALAIHDARAQRVVLARDQLGIKPLFYSVTREGLFFGSEIKAVLAGSGQAPVLRAESLAEYLVFRYTAGSRSFFAGVHRLPAANVAVWQGGKLTIRRYWSLPDAEEAPLTDGEAVSQLDALLSESVSSQLMSEVPLGAFCSGGVDSGLVTAYASGSRSDPIKTFSIGFDDAQFDETALARDTAIRYGTDHHVVVAQPADVRDALPVLLRHHDEPLSHPNAAPLYLLSRLAREHVTVVLTGEGSDELFGGYPRYQIARIRSRVNGLPMGLSRAAQSLFGALPGRRTSLIASQLPLGDGEATVLNSAYVGPDMVTRLLDVMPATALEERLEMADASRVEGNPVASLSRYELMTYLGCALDRMDRMSMAHGLEGRVPFLDVPLVEWATRVSVRHKLRGRQGKHVVKALAADKLSPRVVKARKSGFGLPLGAWFRGPHFADIIERLRDQRHPAAAHFDRHVVGKVVDEHARGVADHGELLWLLCNVYLWHEEIVHGARASVDVLASG